MRLIWEEVVLDILAEVRQRVIEQTSDAGTEIGQLEELVTNLRREITNLAEAVALTKGGVTALAEKLSARQERLAAAEARLQLLKAAPEVFSLEVRRLEAGVRKRIDQLREFFDRDTDEARKILDALLDGPMTFRPIETPEGRR
jgi:site-specific DNA recombinase